MKGRLTALSAAALLVAVLALVAQRAVVMARELDEEFMHVTCGSMIKLTHVATGFKLHSHNIPYGSGSGQQSVTAFPEGDDNNSHWLVVAGFGQPACLRGKPVPCGSLVRLLHRSTNKHLHSHLHKSPLSGNQEVSAFDEQNAGDDWELRCEGSAKAWPREKPVDLVHFETGQFLQAHHQFRYQAPIPGQLEVAAVPRAGANTKWAAQEGVYFAAPI